MEEKFLYHIWDAGHLAYGLKTVNGKAVRIDHPGQFNTQRGPDFMNAVLEIEGEIKRGAVEIHQTTLDWLRHNHQEDHYYNSVILHVVLSHNTEMSSTQREDGEWVEILELKNQLSDDIQKLVQDYHFSAGNPRSKYCDRLSALDNDHLITILNYHGKQRLMGKVKRFNASLSFSDFDQILYEGMMEAAGYDKNKLTMMQLAQSIPFRNLKNWKQEGMTALEMSAILACSSGLVTKSKTETETTVKLKEAYERQPFWAARLELDWQLFRIRPAAHPLKRIISLVDFLYRNLDTGLLQCFLGQVETQSETASKRYTAFQKLLAKGDGEGLSANVADNIYLNIYLPVMFLYAQKTGAVELKKSLLESWNSFKALQDNYLIRYMQSHLNPSQIPLLKRRSLFQQGLIDIYYRYCRYHLCQACLRENQC